MPEGCNYTDWPLGNGKTVCTVPEICSSGLGHFRNSFSITLKKTGIIGVTADKNSSIHFYAFPPGLVFPMLGSSISPFTTNL